MPFHYARDDQRCLITLTITEPCALDELLRAIDRQAAEDTWNYAMLSDLRAVTDLWTAGDLQHIADRVQAAGGGRARGPVGIAVGAILSSRTCPVNASAIDPELRLLVTYPARAQRP